LYAFMTFQCLRLPSMYCSVKISVTWQTFDIQGDHLFRNVESLGYDSCCANVG